MIGNVAGALGACGVRDPSVITPIVVTLVAYRHLAALVPAWRGVDPMTVLRAD
jgi:hypothetical protein